MSDLEGNIWQATEVGLRRLKWLPGKYSISQADPNRVGAVHKTDVPYTDKQGTVWVGTYWESKLLLSGNIGILHYHAWTPDCLFRWSVLWQKIKPGISGFVRK